MFKRCLCLFSILLFCIGCNSKTRHVYHEENKPNYDFPSSFMIEKDNHFAYQPGYECSAFSSSYVLRHYGEDIEGMELYKVMPNKLANGTGVYPKGIVNYFNANGYEAKYVENASIDEIKYEVSLGAPVIVHIHVEEPKETIHATHYVPIVGYDEENFYFAESLEAYANCKDDTSLPYNRKTSIEEFKKLWNNIDGAFDQPYFKIIKKEN